MSQNFDQTIELLSNRLMDGEADSVIQETTKLLESTAPDLEEYRSTLYVILGRAYFNKSDFDSAISWYTKVVESSDASFKDWLQLASVYVVAGDMVHAKDALTAARQKAPSSAEDLGLVLSFMMFLSQNGEMEEAEQYLNELKEFYLKLPSLDYTYLATATGGIPPMLEDVLEQAIPILDAMPAEKKAAWLEDLKLRLRDEDKHVADAVS